MKNIILIGLIIIAGCAVPLVMEKTAVTEIAIDSNSIRGNVKSEYRVLWDLCMSKLEGIEAEDTRINESKGVIKSKVSGITVKIEIDSTDFQTQRMKVSATKFFMPKPEFAQKLFFEIVNEFK